MFEVSEWRPEGKYLPLPPRDKGDGDGVELIPLVFPMKKYFLTPRVGYVSRS